MGCSNRLLLNLSRDNQSESVASIRMRMPARCFRVVCLVIAVDRVCRWFFRFGGITFCPAATQPITR